MKKMIFILCCLVLTLISFLSIKEFESIQFQEFFSEQSAQDYSLYITNGNAELTNEDNYQVLEDLAVELGVNIQRSTSESTADGKNKNVYYVALGDAEDYFSNMPLQSGR